MADLTELQRLAEEASRFTFTKDAHGWVQDCDTWELQDYIAAMHPDTAKKLIAVAEALELVLDCSSQEWQQADGKRMAATDNQGRRFWFITEDVMQAARTALEELK